MANVNIKEFVEKGYLQEVNRNFFHPLGMAITVTILDNGDFKLVGIQDNRDKKEGMIFDLENSDQKRIDIFNKKKKFIEEDMAERIKARKQKYGFGIEPIPEEK